MCYLQSQTLTVGYLMAKLLILLGAGASKLTGTPLMEDFLDRVHDIAAGQGAHFETVIDLVADLEILHSRSAVSLRNIESVFNIVEMAQLVGHLPGPTVTDAAEAAAAMRQVVGETLEKTCRFPIQDGAMSAPKPYDAFANYLRNRNANGRHISVAIITFNYDVALDFALMQSGVPYYYGIADEQDSRGLPLLKLHGSLNWGLCDCGAVRVVTLGEMISTLRLNLATRMSPYMTFPVSQFLGKFEHCPGTALGGPAIVPPSWNKTQHWHSFTSVWKRAAEEVTNAENILVAGYSMPPTDSFFRDLFALGLASRTRVKRFIVANPDKTLADRFRGLLGPTIREVFEFWPEKFEDIIKRLTKIDW